MIEEKLQRHWSSDNIPDFANYIMPPAHVEIKNLLIKEFSNYRLVEFNKFGELPYLYVKSGDINLKIDFFKESIGVWAAVHDSYDEHIYYYDDPELTPKIINKVHTIIVEQRLF